MNVFKENYCRICYEFFCCKACRLDHEESNHGIHRECNICIYGRAFLAKPSESLLQHFRANHWPLHCLLCKTLFTSVEHLTSHSTCAMAQKPLDGENSNIFTIPANATEENYDSPPITAAMHKSILTSSNKHFTDHNAMVWLTTSTPMQNADERELLHEVITPVEFSENTNISDKLKLINASSVNVNSAISEQSKDAEPPLKRRVTFSEIEIINIETPYNSRNTKYIPSYEISSEIKQQRFLSTPGSTNKNDEVDSGSEYKGRHIRGETTKFDMYVTAFGEELGDTPKVPTQEHKNKYNYMNLTQSSATTNDDTKWESALTDPNASIPEVPSTPLSNQDLTESLENSVKSEILSPVVSPDLTDSDVWSPVVDSNLKQADSAANENVTEKIQSPGKNLNLSSKLHSSKPNPNLVKPEYVQSHIIIVNENLENPEILSIVEKQSEIEIDASSPVDYDFKNSVLSPVHKKSLHEWNSVSSPADSCLSKEEIDLEIVSPIADDNLKPEILPLNIQSTVDSDSGINQNDVNFDDIEFCTNSGESTNTSQKPGIWSSMTNIFKTMVQGLSNSAQGNNATSTSLRISLDSVNSTALNDCIKKTNSQNTSYKRSKPEGDASASESPLRKRIKLTHIRCRRTIRSIRPYLELKYGRNDVETVDKSTQTD